MLFLIKDAPCFVYFNTQHCLIIIYLIQTENSL